MDLINTHPGVGNGNSLHNSCLGNPQDRGDWQATVHGVAKSQTQLSNWAYTHHLPWASHCRPCLVNPSQQPYDESKHRLLRHGTGFQSQDHPKLRLSSWPQCLNAVKQYIMLLFPQLSETSRSTPKSTTLFRCSFLLKNIRLCKCRSALRN